MSLLTWIPSRGTLPPSPPHGDHVIVFLHGTLASPGNFQKPAEALAAQGRAFVAPAYGTRGTGDLEASVKELESFLYSLNVKSVDIVGHSLGGLMGLELAHRMPEGFVRTLVGLGACWRGVPITYRFPRLVKLVGGPAYTQLTERDGSLADKKLPSTRIISIVSKADRIVPESSATLGEVRYVTGVRHEHLPQLSDDIIAALPATSP